MKQTKFLGYIALTAVLYLNLCYTQCYFAREICLYFYISTLRSVCAVSNTAFFLAVPLFRAFLVCCMSIE